MKCDPMNVVYLCPQSILIRWTKGFKCSGVEGEDVVKLLKEAVRRRGVNMLFIYCGGLVQLRENNGDGVFAWLFMT